MTITEPAVWLPLCSVVSNVTCNGGSDGAADVNASGGTAHILELVHLLVLLQVLILTMYLTRTVVQLPVQ